MLCFQHTPHPAIGACVVCGKGVCQHCQLKEDFLICSQACKQTQSERLLMHEKAKQIYGIGGYQTVKRNNADWLSFLLIGILFLGFVNIQAFTSHHRHLDSSYYFMSLFGIVCLIISLLYWKRGKRFGLKI